MATTLEILLNALNRSELPPIPAPAPSMPLPVSTAGPQPGPMLGAAPQAPPTAPLPALDMNFVNQYAGAAPVAPVQSDPNWIDKLAAVLGGISQGPGYAMALREERERPIREYNAQLERYQGRRARGVEIATDRQQRGQELATREAERNADREFQLYEQGIRDRRQEARDLRQQASLLEREDRRARAEQQEIDKRARGQQERDARLIARDFGKVGAKPEIALQLGRYYSGLTDEISPEAAKFESAQARLAEVRLRRAAAGGSGSGGTSSKALKVAQEIDSIKAKMVEAEARGDMQAVKQLMTRAKAAVRNSARFPEVEAGFDSSGKWPYVKLRTAQGSVALPGGGAAQAQAPSAAPVMTTPPPETVQAYMDRFGIKDRNQAIRELMQGQ